MAYAMWRSELLYNSPVEGLLRVSAAAEVVENAAALKARPVALRNRAGHHRRRHDSKSRPSDRLFLVTRDAMFQDWLLLTRGDP